MHTHASCILYLCAVFISFEDFLFKVVKQNDSVADWLLTSLLVCADLNQYSNGFYQIMWTLYPDELISHVGAVGCSVMAVYR